MYEGRHNRKEVLCVPRKHLSFGTAALAMVESGFCKAGDYFREMAVLIVAFIPLDLWKHEEITALRIVEVLAASLGLFLFGVVCEWTSYGVKRGKAVWEEEEAR
jgi:hypothetical protein